LNAGVHLDGSKFCQRYMGGKGVSSMRELEGVTRAIAHKRSKTTGEKFSLRKGLPALSGANLREKRGKYKRNSGSESRAQELRWDRGREG